MEYTFVVKLVKTIDTEDFYAAREQAEIAKDALQAANPDFKAEVIFVYEHDYVTL